VTGGETAVSSGAPSRSLLLSTVIAAAFAVLGLGIDGLRDSESQANRALEVQVAASHLERLAIDIETTQRGYIITGDRLFLQLWYQARSKFLLQAKQFEHLASASDASQSRLARQIVAARNGHMTNYAVPLVA
jgi:CHASE3 domain sensor protein